MNKISKSFKLTDFSTIDTASMLRDYYDRIDKYYSRFPSRSRGIRNNSVIPILWYDDIRNYIGRLRKWFLKIIRLMNKISNRCFIVEVNDVQYVVKYGKIDEFLCLFLPSVVIIQSMTTSPVSWSHEYMWYKRI